MPVLYIVLGVLAFLGLVLIGVYNGFARGNIKVQEAWSHIDIELKKRADLVPDLVESVKGIMKQEQTVFQGVADARSAVMKSSGVKEMEAADAQMSSAIGRLLAVAENYPEVKSHENFKELQSQLVNIEDRIAYARTFYNKVVMEFNTKLAVFPAGAIGKMFGFSAKELFEASEDDRKDVDVKF